MPSAELPSGLLFTNACSLCVWSSLRYGLGFAVLRSAGYRQVGCLMPQTGLKLSKTHWSAWEYSLSCSSTSLSRTVLTLRLRIKYFLFFRKRRAHCIVLCSVGIPIVFKLQIARRSYWHWEEDTQTSSHGTPDISQWIYVWTLHYSISGDSYPPPKTLKRRSLRSDLRLRLVLSAQSWWSHSHTNDICLQRSSLRLIKWLSHVLYRRNTKARCISKWNRICTKAIS